MYGGETEDDRGRAFLEKRRTPAHSVMTVAVQTGSRRTLASIARKGTERKKKKRRQADAATFLVRRYKWTEEKKKNEKEEHEREKKREEEGETGRRSRRRAEKKDPAYVQTLRVSFFLIITFLRNPRK